MPSNRNTNTKSMPAPDKVYKVSRNVVMIIRPGYCFFLLLRCSVYLDGRKWHKQMDKKDTHTAAQRWDDHCVHLPAFLGTNEHRPYLPPKCCAQFRCDDRDRNIKHTPWYRAACNFLWIAVVRSPQLSIINGKICVAHNENEVEENWLSEWSDAEEYTRTMTSEELANRRIWATS